MDISTYFAAAAGASAALMGLLFVALQFNLERRSDDVNWRPVARASFNIFTVLFVASMFALIPFPDLYESDRLIFLIVAVVAIYRQVTIWLPIWNQLRKERLIHTFWLMVAPVLLYLLMIYYALQPPGNPSNLHDIQIPEATIIVALFITALRNSWELIIEAGAVKSSTD